MSISNITVTASSMAQKSLNKRASLARGIATMFVGGLLLTATASPLQAQINWSGATNGDWLTGSNWIGGVPAGSDITTTNTDIAVFNNNTNTTVGINMNATAGVYYLGAIEKTNVNARTINNNTTTPGILTLNGATVNSVANSILSNNTINLLTITNGSGAGTLGLELGNTTNNIIQITNSGGITIAGVISGAGRNLTKQGAGAGVLTLSGINTYSGTTTISGGVLAANSSSAVGDGSTTNTLIFNGGTLQATGAITSPATRGVTLTSTGIIDTNGRAVSIAGNITGAGGLIKNSAGTLALSGINSYAGPTRINSGTVVFASKDSLYNNTPLSWTAANINVKSGSTFTVNVDSAGTSGFDAASLATLLGNISVANTASSGLQGGTTIALDTSTATGGTFSLNTPLTNSTGAFGGTIGLAKLGAGTLVLDQANTYTGPTSILGGTLQLDNSGSISTGTVLINGTLLVNKSGTLTQGTNFPAQLNGNGSLDYNGGGTLTLNTANLFYGSTTASSGTIALTNARALQNSALVTTGGGGYTLVGPTTLTLGGLSGAAGDLATTGIFNGTYSSLTSLTLNPFAGTVTYGGAITNGAAGMTLTKTGAGTQVLQGVNTYSGATNINASSLSTSSGNTSILELSGSGSILNSAVTLSGGQLRLSNTVAETGSGRVSNTASITAVAGTISYNNTDNTEIYAETIGSVALTSGHVNIVQSVDQIAGGSQTLTLAGLTRTGATNTSTVAFSAPITGLNATTNRIQVNGAAATPAGQIIGPWATTGTAAILQTDYAVYDGSGNVVPANISPSAETTWTSATDAYTSDSSVSLSANRTIAALRNTGTSATITLSDGANGYTLATNGILSANNSVLSIVAGSPEGQITAPGASGGQIYINTGGSKPWALTANNNNILPNGVAMNISAPINDNGGAVTLVKTGENSVLYLTGANNYSGGTIINSGILLVNGDGALGASTGDITLNGGQLRFSANNLTFNADRDVIVGPAGGSIAPIGNQTTINFNGKLTGAGTLAMGNTAGAGGRNAFFNSTDNDFTGEVSIPSLSSIFRVNSFADTVGAGDIILYKGIARSDQASFEYGTGAIAPLTLNNRSIQIVNDTGTAFSAAIVSNLNTSQPITVNTDLISIGATARTLQLNAAAGPVNVFAGKITDGSGGGILNVTKTGGGTWTLSGNNSFSGGVTLNGATVGSQLNINSTSALGTGTFTISGGNSAKIDNTSGNPLTLSTNNGQSWLNDFEFVGSNDLNLGTGNVTLFGNRNLNITASTLTVGGAINGSFGIAKNGAGTLALGGANDYLGTTSVNVGKLLINGNSSAATGPVNVNSAAILGGSGTVGGLTTVASAGIVAPGNSAGNLTFAAGVDLSAGGVYSWEIGALSTANPGTNFDLITVSGGNLALGGASTLTLDFGLIPATDPNSADAFWTSSRTWKIIDVTGGTNTGDTNLSTITNASYTSGNFTTTVGTGADQGDIFLVFTSNTVAGTSIWQGANNDPWTAASSWNGSVPNSASAEARFETTGGTTAVLDANQTVNKLTFDATAPHTISGASTLTLAGTTPVISTAGTNTATQTIAVNLDLAAGTSVSVQGGTLELNSPANAVLGAGVTATVATGATLSLGGAGNALSNGTSTHANVANSGTLTATTAGKRVGEISGTGTTTVTTAGATLTANHIRQSTLNIGAGNTVTVATNGGNSGTSTLTTLSINATGKLDLNDNDLIVDNGNLATLTAKLATGLDINGSYGNGPGITSTAFATNPNFNTVLGIAANVELGYTSFSGQTVDANDILIKYTYYGDADLSGSVDTSTDFDLYITGLTSGGSLGGWLFGDFDYNGTVDSSTDFDLYITGLTTQGGALLTAGGGGNLVQAVPEPSTFVLGGLALLGFAGVGLRRRRLAQPQA